MSNKGATTKEIMDKIKAIVEGLPFFLKPGVLKKDVMTMIFDNKCRIIGQNTTKTGGIGFTIHLLFIDEFAHIPEGIKRTFYENVYPTLSSSKISRVIITSTPNGFDLFHDLYTAAVDGNNEYKAMRVDWWEVPGRDEAWKEREIANLGSLEAFNQQYGCQFLSSSNLLLSSDELKRLKRNEAEFIFHEFDPLDDLGLDYSQLKWHPDFDPLDIEDPKKFFIFAIDLAEGIGRDYSVINIFELDSLSYEDIEKLESPGSISDFFSLRQVGLFRSNIHSIENFSKVLYTLAVKIFEQENIRMVVEYNVYGAELMKNLITIYPTSNDFDEDTVVKYHHRVGAKVKQPGLRMNKDLKKIYCEKMKSLVMSGKIQLTERQSIQEASLFSRNPSGTYSAQTGNDDIIMTAVSVSSFFDTLDFADLVEEFFEFLDDEKISKIEEILDEIGDDNGEIYDIF